MENDSITPNEVLAAFEQLGSAIGGYDEIEIVLVGGMAGRLAGWFSETETTKDCDVMAYSPEQAFGYVESEAFKVAQSMGLPRRWLNSASHGFDWALPAGWQDRKHLIGRYGLLIVYHVSRVDLIALKVVASRDVDRSHLLTMDVTDEDLSFVEEHLDRLADAGRSPERIEKARNTIDILRASQ